MKTNSLIKGIHHVTATVNDAREDYDFYTHLLGLRLVKKTVNFDNNQVYHFYYGNETGEPGSIMTTFPYKGHKVNIGAPGTGQVAVTAFSVPLTGITGKPGSGVEIAGLGGGEPGADRTCSAKD